MRSRPDISISFLPEAPRPGDVLEVTVVVESGSPTPVSAIVLELSGRERVTSGGDWRTTPIVEELVTLEGPTLLERGSHTYEARIGIPLGAPPSYDGRLASIRYSLHARVVIPRWLDANEIVDVEVLAAPRRRSEIVRCGDAQTERTRDGYPEVRVELDDWCVGPGDTLNGRYLLNVPGRRADALVWTLVACERVRGDPDDTRDPGHGGEASTTWDAEVVFEGLPDGATEAWRTLAFRVPTNVVPAFGTGRFELSWTLSVRAEAAGQALLVTEIPIALAMLERRRRRGRPSTVPPAAGQDGRGARWARLAREGGLERVDVRRGGDEEGRGLELAGDASGAAARIAAGPSPKGGLVGELCWPSWGLDLRIRARQHVGDGLALGRPWDDVFGVRGREAAQVRDALSPKLCLVMAEIVGGGGAIELGDDGARAWVPSPPADESAVARFIAKLCAVAAEARACAERIAPPAAMEAAGPAWARFAARTEGVLRVGDMSIRSAHLDGSRIDVETRFDGVDPELTRVTVHLDPPIRGEAGEPIDMAPSARALANDLERSARALRAAHDRLEMDLPAPLWDPGDVENVLVRLILLGRKLRGHEGTGPYR